MHVRWPMESHSERMPSPPQLDGGVSDSRMESESLVDTACGMILEMVPLTVPASRAFTPAELERRIAAHAERVEKMAVAEVRPRKKAVPSKCPAVRKAPLDLKLVSCAGCERSLLGESQEPLRATKFKRYTLPQPVAARLFHGRPYCARCAADYAS